MDDGEVILFVFGLLVLAGLAVMWMGIQSRRQVREMEHREKMAMIERGLMPPPELDPVGFEERMGARAHASESSVRSRTAGVMMMGIGFALMMLIAFTGGELGVGLGVGGAFAAIGAAFFINASMLSRDPAHRAPSSPRPLPRIEPKDPAPPLS